LLRAMGWRFGKSIGWARIAALGLVLGCSRPRVLDPVPVQIIRNLTFDFYHQMKPRAPAPFPVAILDIDDPSIAEIGQWPWPRNRIADLVTRATADGAVAIAFDIVFAEPDRLSPPQIAPTTRTSRDFRARSRRCPTTTRRWPKPSPPRG
jgi:adenylate cyclase